MDQVIQVMSVCALYNSTDPPSFNIANDTYQLYPIDRNLCTDIDPYKDTIFELYTRNNPEEPHILRTGEDSLLQNSFIDFNKTTIIFFHGYLESTKSDDAVQIRKRNSILHIEVERVSLLSRDELSNSRDSNETFHQDYLERSDFNVILVNNRRLLAGPFYLTAARNCEPIGKYSAKFVDYLVEKGLKLSMLHIIGMSLGGQIAGYTGKYLQSGKASRVTGLDPAGPYFNILPANRRISKDDAEFVDIIHTNAGAFGLKASCGHVDIWVNGGTLQPGCSALEVMKRKPGSVPELVFCNHYQAYRVYVQSLINSTAYEATQCLSYRLYRTGLCKSNAVTYMGVDVDRTAEGNYYITTGVTAVDI